MSNRSGWLVLAVMTLTLAAGCSGEPQATSPAGPSVSVSGTGANQGVSASVGAGAATLAKLVPRDVSGGLEGRFTFDGPWEGPWTTTGDAMGTLTHLGLSRMHTTHTANPNGTISGGVFEIVAANGDKIQGSYTASAEVVTYVPYVVAGAATLRIRQGSGRFENATGTIEATFLETLDADYLGANVRWTLNGTVNY